MSFQHAPKALVKFLLHAYLAWIWEYSLRDCLISEPTYVSSMFALIICFAAASEFLVGLERRKAIVCSLIFSVGWLCYRHLLYINIVWSLLLTYMTWANPTPFNKPRASEYIMAAALTFLATAGFQITHTHWVGIGIRMIPLLNIWNQTK